MPSGNWNNTLSSALSAVAEHGRNTADWAATNPGKAAALGVSSTLLIVPMVVAGPALAAVGFGANGIVAGSAAAGIQSGIGSVIGPSLFATLQSAGAAGYGVAAVSGAVQAAGAAVAASVGAASVLETKNQKSDNLEGDGPATEKKDQKEDDESNEDDEKREL